ncbi:MAG TPA: DUF1684 domain-containing protein [Chryseosolibacter sp.]
MIERMKSAKSGVLSMLLTFCILTSYAQDDVLAKNEIEAHRKKQESEMRDKEKSPLDPKDRKRFKHLNYFPIDLKYRVKAKFVRTENEPLFKMKTTTTRLPEYVKYGEVHFQLDGMDYKLNVYQSPEITKRPGYEDYLFIPFTDITNGNETYEVGRYLEFRIPTSEDVIVDFNQCYNPYCSYSPRFSCPIPPSENDLAIAIPAGEKKFKDSSH